jgi:hypothetical protein
MAMTNIRVALLLAGLLVLVAGCGGTQESAGPDPDDPATQGLVHYLNGDFDSALSACKMLETRDHTSSEQMRFHVLECLAMRPAIYLLWNDPNSAKSQIAAGCATSPEFGWENEYYCAFTAFIFGLHATDQHWAVGDPVLTDTFLMECGVSLSEIAPIIEAIGEELRKEAQQSGYY